MVFLPRPLLEPPLELLQNDKAAAGLGICSTSRSSAGPTGERTFDLDWMEGAAGVRLTVLRAREV